MSTPVKADEMQNKSRIPWLFQERWRIRGSLMANTPLHIGSGSITYRDDLIGDEGKGPVDIADCLRDVQGKPVIPATSLRGVMRAWMEQVADADQCKRLLGEDSERNNSGRGGEAEFLDAFMSQQSPDNVKISLPHWDLDKQTWVEIINSIDRERGTAAENHLAHREVVAPGSVFQVTITGQFSRPEQDIPLLLAALDAFNHPEDPIRIGADTASGQGRMRWNLETVEKIGRDQVLAWLNLEGERGMADTAFRIISNEEHSHLEKIARQYGRSKSGRRNIPLVLKFDGPFLVNDPQSKKQIEIERDLPPQQRTPDARPRVDKAGRPILPAKSFRGILRSHGEKILRTMLELDEEKWQEKDIQKWIEKHIACRPEIAARACSPLKDGKDPAKHLCLACQVFGAPGWRSPIAMDDFSLDGELQDYEIQTQEFVAVDRFTGGGRDQAKYKSRAIIDPIFQGQLRIDEERLPSWGLGILSLVLRDLKDGWLRFGWGASAKGYGICKGADITSWDDPVFQRNAAQSWEKLLELIEDLRNKLSKIADNQKSG